MKHNTRFSFLPTALLSFLLAVAVTGCIATAFDLTLFQGMGQLILLCGLFALAISIAFQLCHTAVPVTLFFTALLLLLYQGSQQPLQMQTLLPSITTPYHNAYGWPVLLENPPMATGADLACLRLALVICFFLCWVLSRRKHLLLSLLPLSPILCCFVVIDTVPGALYFALLLLCICLLLLTHFLRRQEHANWGALGAKLTPAVALFLALIFLLTPQTDSQNPLRDYAGKLLPWIEDLITGTGGSFVGPSTATGVNLSTLGPKRQSNAIALYVTSSKSERTYLRHKAMTHYTGTNWQPTSIYSETFGTLTSQAPHTITIRTVRPKSHLYIPYFPDEPLVISDGILPNDSQKTTYTYGLVDHYTVEANPPARYTDLPNSTRNWASALVSDILNGTTETRNKAQLIGEYVQNSASYSLDTQQMPSSSKDFAQWFLESSDTGYCVHFATAATVLLRAAGIPALYVEGMAFRSVANQEVTVANSNAHAWVEYYDEASNTWNILDPTPAVGIPDDEPDDKPVVKPDDPDTPDTPDTPDNPDTPDTPDTPNNPDTPDTPDNPNTPDTPDTPDNPDTPDTPDTPDDPGQMPDTPDLTPDDYAKIDLWAWLTQLLRAARLVIMGAALFALLLLQWLLRKRHHRRRWNTGSTNAQALERFRQCRRLAEICKQELPEQLTELAQKARFSQYSLADEELAVFDDFRSQTLAKAKKGNPLRRLALRFIFALI